ncbi:MAG: glycosyltransferase family 4 protein [Pirellulales bacterium]|nr:glycosyltransferase family 4 protein [Pirellulales bacterium]
MKRSNTVLSVFNLAPRRVGGMETMMRELSSQLGARGWTSVLCFRSEPVDAVREFLSLPNVRLEVLPELHRWSVACQAQLARMLKRYRAAIAHLNFLDFFAPYAAVARAVGVARVYFTDHISRPENHILQKSGWLKVAAYRAAVPVTKVLCVSDFVRGCWLASGRLPSDRFVTVYNGVDLDRCDRSQAERASFRRRYGLGDGDVAVTQISSLIEEKGCSTVLEAARIVCAASPAVTFFMAGDGPRRPEYEGLAERLGVSGRVRFLGLVEDPVGQGLFSGSDIVCQASRWQEAFGLSIAEAMACRRPVVATRVGGIPELVQEGRTGLLADRGDAAGLAASVMRLVQSPSLRSSLGSAARDRCAAYFDHRAIAAKVIDLYQLPA